ncbi:substrate-binding domain-containing protein [Carboxylicivirga marina]|uniref:Substrate-binding domain-containing protein n=1 Tax=Carboxylicivirga marina TaxID=2800988 RepID=A0ABS1HPR7_9BACT|nr:substrate-binding domain-containing protein [Carboxylicivirga marina]MBK3519674.1 substrate-binding domain-containing protein [Carboxylicivirga marina]
MKLYTLLIAFILLGFISNAQDYKVIVHSSSTVTSISKSQLSKYFLKKDKKWDDGTKVTVIDQSSRSETRKQFSNDVLGKSVGAIKSYWQQYVFAGTGTPPLEKKTDAEVVAFIKSHPGAIGYVASSANTDGTKVITIQ